MEDEILTVLLRSSGKSRVYSLNGSWVSKARYSGCLKFLQQTAHACATNPTRQSQVTVSFYVQAEEKRSCINLSLTFSFVHLSLSRFYDYYFILFFSFPPSQMKSWRVPLCLRASLRWRVSPLLSPHTHTHTHKPTHREATQDRTSVCMWRHTHAAI